MARYGEEYRRTPGFRPRGRRQAAWSGPARRRARARYETAGYGERPYEAAGYGYGPYGAGAYGYDEYRYGRYAGGRGYGRGYGREYGAAYREWPGERWLPHKPARGYPVRGYHTYDLDYGDLAGPTTDYSGRAGYSTGEPEWEWTPRGPYTPTLEEIGRAARLRHARYGGRGAYRGRRRSRS